ncbi:MAG: DUF58 domain-containing protein [Planctomycetota bacterium]|nr:DUF58 domain-containing protein [Planctomycetota bacterium]
MASPDPRRAADERPPPEADPSMYLHPQTLARLSSFELRAKLIVEGISSGQHRSPYRGLSVEFAQHRPYVPGDDLRHLDWKVFGRTDKLYLKQHQQETNLDLMLLVDASGSMFYGSRSFADASGTGKAASVDGRATWSKFDHATALAAAIAYVTLGQGDRVGLMVFADEIRAIVRRSSSQSTWRQIVGALNQHPVDPAERARPTSLSRVIDQVRGKVTNRSIVVIASDLFMDPADLQTALARLRHAGHDVIVFQVLDKAEEEFAFTDSAPFVGLEGEAAVRIDPRGLRKAYLEVFRKHQAEVSRIVRGMNFDWETISTHDWLGPPLAAFIARRNAMLKRSSA